MITHNQWTCQPTLVASSRCTIRLTSVGRVLANMPIQVLADGVNLYSAEGC